MGRRAGYAAESEFKFVIGSRQHSTSGTTPAIIWSAGVLGILINRPKSFLAFLP